MTLYLLIVFLSAAIGAISVVLFAHGQGFWISLDLWETKSTALFEWRRLDTRFLDRRPFVQGRLRFWRNTVLYRHDLSLAMADLKQQGPDNEQFNAGINACISFLQSPAASSLKSSADLSNQTGNF